MKNRKGFTLIEVLVTIVILGIISSIAIASIINIRKNQEIKFDNNQWQMFEETARIYFLDNKSSLPITPGKSNTVYLRDLIEKNYLDSLLDYDKKSYDLDKSYVTVKKIGKTYVYTPTLVKSNSSGKDEIVENTELASGKIDFKNYKKAENLYMNCTMDDGTTNFNCSKDSNVKTYYANKNPQVEAVAEDNDNIIAYTYSIYKDNKKIYTSEFIDNDNISVKDKFILDTSNYNDGKYKIKVTVYDKYGYTTSKSTKEILIDLTNPSCTTEKSPNVEWTNTTTTITGICTDNNSKSGVNSGCKSNSKNVYKEEMNSIGNPGPVEDLAGNSTTCDNVEVKIDKTAPRCGTYNVVSGTKGTNEWYISDLTLKVDCNDISGSGCLSQSFEKIFTEEGTKARKITIKDNAGNTATCESSAYSIDKTPPKCESSGGQTTWTNGSVTLTGKCTDNGSGCVSSISKTISSETNSETESPGVVNDNAGNSTVCPANQTVRIDKTSPICGNWSASGTAGDNDWYTSNLSLTVSCTETSGSGCTESTFTKAFSSEGTKTRKITIKDNAGNTTACESVYSIDITAPTCNGWTGESTTWTKNDRTIKVKCSDSTAGCVETSYTVKTYSSGTTKTAALSKKIKDNAGNTKTCSKTANVYVDKEAPKFGDIYKKTAITKDDKKWNEFGYYISDNGGSGVDKASSLFEYCYTGHTNESCGATCSNGNAYSHKPSKILGESAYYYDRYYQTANFDENNISPLYGGVLTECITGHTVIANFYICDKVGNCSKKMKVFDWST